MPPIMINNDELVVKKIIRTSAIINELLTPSENRALISFIEDFQKQRISHNDFGKSIQLLFEKQLQVDEDGKTQHLLLRCRDPKINRTESKNRLAIRAKVDEYCKEYPIRHKGLKIRVTSDERESGKYVTKAFNLEGKKRRVLHTEPVVERPLKKPRKSKRLILVTPSYKLIPEEEQSPVSDPVVNNKYVLAKVGASGHKKITRYEEAMAVCEDDMFERDREIGALTNTVDSAEKVIEGEMKLEDLGVLFYRCIEKQCGRDISQVVRQDHKEALPVILPMLKQKLIDLTVARDELKPGWKRVFEENTAKQREFAAQSHRRILKAKQQLGI